MISAFSYHEEDRFACYMLASSNKLTPPTGGCTISVADGIVAGWDRRESEDNQPVIESQVDADHGHLCASLDGACS